MDEAQQPVQQTPGTESPLQQTPLPIQPRNWHKIAIFGFFGTVVLAVIALFFFIRFYERDNSKHFNDDSSILPTQISSTSDTPSPTNNPNKIDASFKSVPIGLYNTSVSIPETWTLKEINRKPEPQEAYMVKRGHDCAEYTIQSPDKYLELSIRPVCGYTDGGGLPLPKDAVIINRKTDSKSIYARIFYENKIYQYVSASEVNIEDSTGKHEEMYYGAHLVFQSNEPEELTGFISATYTGPDTLKESYLSTADKIVATFIK